MSTYNTVIWECLVPLPDGWTGTQLQSGSFDDFFADEHKVLEDGTLMISTVISMESVPKEKRPFPDASGLKSMIGSLSIKTELRPSDLTGYIELEGYDEETQTDHDYMAKFKDGKLIKIIMREEYERLIADV